MTEADLAESDPLTFPSLSFGHPLHSRKHFPSSSTTAILSADHPTNIVMKPAPAKKSRIRIAVLESDPLRFVGFRALFDTESDLEILASSIPELSSLGSVDLVLLGSRNGQNLFDTMAGLKAARPGLKIMVTGSGDDDETILKALAAGAIGYVEEAAARLEFVQAIRMIH